MTNGKIKWYNVNKGYGFIIEDETGEEYFVHHSQLPKGLQLKEGDLVSFTGMQSDRGKQATSVKLI